MAKRKVLVSNDKRPPPPRSAKLDLRVTRTEGAIKVTDRILALVALVAITAMFMAFVLNH